MKATKVLLLIIIVSFTSLVTAGPVDEPKYAIITWSGEINGESVMLHTSIFTWMAPNDYTGSCSSKEDDFVAKFMDAVDKRFDGETYFESTLSPDFFCSRGKGNVEDQLHWRSVKAKRWNGKTRRISFKP